MANHLETEFRGCHVDLVEDDSFAGDDPSSLTPRPQQPLMAANFLTSTPFAGGISLEEGALADGDTPLGIPGDRQEEVEEVRRRHIEERRYLQSSESTSPFLTRPQSSLTSFF